MPLANAAKDAMLNHFRTLATHASLHSASPPTAANELTGGTPAYARRAITWNAAANGNLDDSGVPAFDVPGGVTVAAFGLWSALTAGTFYGGDPVSTAETFAGQGTYTLTDLDVNLTG